MNRNLHIALFTAAGLLGGASFCLDDAEFERLAIQGVREKWLDKVTEVASEAAKRFVESKPIYLLEVKDAKTATAKLLLKDFEVRDQAIYVNLGL